MGLHWRLLGSSSLSKLRYNSINTNPFHHTFIHKQTRRLIHDISTSENPTTFLLKRLYADNKSTFNQSDRYLSVISSTNRKGPRRITIEKNLYFRSPPSRPRSTCPFAVIGTVNKNNTMFSNDILERPYSYSIVGCCDGLICLRDSKKDGTVLLWNPLINDVKVLDCSSVKIPRGVYATNFKCAGFGFDPESKDYKVVISVVYNNAYCIKEKRSKCHYEVYSLKTGSWLPLPNPEVHPFEINSRASVYLDESQIHRASVYVDGFYYWAARNSTNIYPNFILSFNFATEKFSFFPVPKTGKPIGPYTYNLVEYEGLLGFVLYLKEEGEKNFEVWVREKDKTWSKVTCFCVPGAKKPLGYWSNGKWFFQGINSELLMFDATTKEVEHLDIYDFNDIMELVPFVESTTPLHPTEK